MADDEIRKLSLRFSFQSFHIFYETHRIRLFYPTTTIKHKTHFLMNNNYIQVYSSVFRVGTENSTNLYVIFFYVTIYMY